MSARPHHWTGCVLRAYSLVTIPAAGYTARFDLLAKNRRNDGFDTSEAAPRRSGDLRHLYRVRYT
ncbi:uncharacterized protein PHALS_14025 [Plasmopara halstedii]|uniref:Uncharacterized protein n=1 Tax=Plasmopara halstedii TaxID=4781 RepID=A0A0N7L6A5_PLAHL|nr:uncharacterized protein PHALS_14025 [Plasmopara halstedii]CEG43731.1 hypothetical protein PHALS_14025 [Plasmopara halstedii]|eukprot:XP_024580100.1 hypothetical protein PHALS_14025 [Plasmopara halstedii]